MSLASQRQSAAERAYVAVRALADALEAEDVADAMGRDPKRLRNAVALRAMLSKINEETALLPDRKP